MLVLNVLTSFNYTHTTLYKIALEQTVQHENGHRDRWPIAAWPNCKKSI